MSRSWTEEELQMVSKAMKEEGHMSFEEFCESLEASERTIHDNGESSTESDE